MQSAKRWGGVGLRLSSVELTNHSGLETADHKIDLFAFKSHATCPFQAEILRVSAGTRRCLLEISTRG